MACRGNQQRDSKGRFVAKSKSDKTPVSKAAKARSQRRDAKGHFIPGYKDDQPEVDIVVNENEMITLTVPAEDPVAVSSWYQKLGEVADKLTLVVSGLNKLVDFKDYISGNKKDK